MIDPEVIKQIESVKVKEMTKSSFSYGESRGLDYIGGDTEGSYVEMNFQDDGTHYIRINKDEEYGQGGLQDFTTQELEYIVKGFLLWKSRQIQKG